jgi:hypothetical protein
MADPESFTQRVVAELAPHIPPLSCCRRALVEGMWLVSDDTAAVSTTRLVAARAAMSSLHAERIPVHVVRVALARRMHYVLSGADVSEIGGGSASPCCTRSRVRGAFLAAGTVVRPAREPHLEISCARAEASARIAADLAALGVAATVRERRSAWVVMVRSSQAVGTALSSIGAQGGRLDFEAGRVVRDMRSHVNRRLNAETANLRRTAAAGVRQMAAIMALLAGAATGAARSSSTPAPPSPCRPGRAGRPRRMQPLGDGRPAAPPGVGRNREARC